jgi:predicted dithiol-disulfide oxidoreductase (DUF899 family)
MDAKIDTPTPARDSVRDNSARAPNESADAGPMWGILDDTPEGRGADWYPKLDYA